MNTEQLNQILPIKFNNKNILLLQEGDLLDYQSNMEANYYNKYNDCDFRKLGHDILREHLLRVIDSQTNNVNSDLETRLVIKDNLRNFIGGFSIKFNNTNIEIGYFITPTWQNKGIARKALKALVKALLENFEKYEYVKLVIRYDNIASIKVAESCGFEKISKVETANGVNYTYKYSRQAVER